MFANAYFIMGSKNSGLYAKELAVVQTQGKSTKLKAFCRQQNKCCLVGKRLSFIG